MAKFHREMEAVISMETIIDIMLLLTPTTV
jgi:hypothetical protein